MNSDSYTETISVKGLLLFILRRWRILLAAMITGGAALAIFKFIPYILGVSGTSLGSVIKYAILGLLVGFILPCLFYFFQYILDSRLRSEEELAGRYGLYSLGSLYCPVRKDDTAIDRLLNTWEGFSAPAEPDKEYALLASRLQAIAEPDVKRLMLTGTIDEASLRTVAEQLEKALPDGRFELILAPQLLYNAEAMKTMKDCSLILAEAKDVSKISELDKLMSFARKCNLHFLGAILL